MKKMFRSLREYNYRIWASGAIVSNVGTWMQRTAQDWIVLTQLTHHNATALGIVLALQFGPPVLLLPFTGLAADRLNRQKLLMATQASMGLLAMALGLLTVTGMITLWEVYLFAFLLGCVSAFDSPVRQTFVSELVTGPELTNAVGLNSTSFNVARMIGPAVAGLLIAAVGTGWVFILNGFSFVAVLISLTFIRKKELHTYVMPARKSTDFIDGFRYVWRRVDLRYMLIMFFLIGTFSANFPIFISTMSVTVFHAGASAYGVLSSFMAIGSVAGALLAARREKPRLAIILYGAAILGFGIGLAAISPTYLLFAFALIVVGIAAQTFTTTINSIAQLTTAASMRGRVMAIVLAVGLGGTPIGGPLIGIVVDHFGPRAGVAVGSLTAFIAALVGVYYLVRHRGLRIRRYRWRPVVSLAELPPANYGLLSTRNLSPANE